MVKMYPCFRAVVTSNEVYTESASVLFNSVFNEILWEI